MVSLRRVLPVAVLMALSPGAGWCLDQTPTGFYYPTGLSDLNHYGHYADWLARYPQYFSGWYHIGKDIAAPEGSGVYAIASGTVVRRSLNGWNANSTDNNIALGIRHQQSDGSDFVALYGHIHSGLVVGNSVDPGDLIGTIGPYGGSSHLHFGICPGSLLPATNLGRMPESSWADTNGFVDPVDWITTRSPRGGGGGGLPGDGPPPDIAVEPQPSGQYWLWWCEFPPGDRQGWKTADLNDPEGPNPTGQWILGPTSDWPRMWSPALTLTPDMAKYVEINMSVNFVGQATMWFLAAKTPQDWRGINGSYSVTWDVPNGGWPTHRVRLHLPTTINRICLRPINHAGSAIGIDFIRFVPRGWPTAPTALSPGAADPLLHESAVVRLSWTDHPMTDGDPRAGDIIEVYDRDTGEKLTVDAVTNVSGDVHCFDWTPPRPGRYAWRVEAGDGIDRGAWSNDASHGGDPVAGWGYFRVRANDEWPAAPTNLHPGGDDPFSAVGTPVRLSWTDHADAYGNMPAGDILEVYDRDTGTKLTVDAETNVSGDRKYFDWTPSRAGHYKWRVEAGDGIDRGAWSTDATRGGSTVTGWGYFQAGTVPEVSSATYVDATHVNVVFSKTLLKASAETVGNYGVPYLTVSAAALQGDGKTVRLTTTPQAGSRTYTAFASHVRDLAGHAMARTGSASWTTPLAVVKATHVDPTHVDVLFSGALDKTPAETVANYQVPYLTVSGAALQADAKTVRLTTSNQPPNRTFTVFVQGVKDQAGGGLARTNTASWNTPAASLTVTSATGVNATHVDVLFSEAVQQASAETLTNYNVPYLTLSAAVLQGDGKTVRLTTTPQPPNRTFTVFVSKVKNVAGVAMAGTKKASWTTPGLASVPALTAVSVQATPAGVAVTYSLSAAAAVEITVTNVAGRVVARIPGGLQESGAHTALWSGRGVMGTRVPGGRYLFQVTAADADGNKTTALVPAMR